MSQIALEGMRFYAYHGFYEEEQIIGNNYVIDVYIKTNFAEAAQEDDLFKTINYETVYLICQREMRIKTKLLEAIVLRIVDGLKFQFKNMAEVKIKIKKENPMPGVKLDSSSIEVSQNFVKECPRCESPTICYGDHNCWREEIQIHPQTKLMLEQKFGDCLCRECLTYFGG
ncbi:MAG: dihydroneopterin aldolase [Bacteroidota bacterium]